MKSFVPKDQLRRDREDDDPGNTDVNFRGQKRSNVTHESTTDPQARLRKKAAGQEAKLCFGLHALMENRRGLYVDLQIRSAVGVTESDVALQMLRQQKRARTVGADKGYHHGPFVQGQRPEDRRFGRADRAHHHLCAEPENPQAHRRRFRLDEGPQILCIDEKTVHRTAKKHSQLLCPNPMDMPNTFSTEKITGFSKAC